MDNVLRKPASLRLQANLLDLLKERTKASNRSFNNFVESILLEAMSLNKSDNSISLELQAKIDKGRGEYRHGDTLHFESIQEMNEWLEAL